MFDQITEYSFCNAYAMLTYKSVDMYCKCAFNITYCVRFLPFIGNKMYQSILFCSQKSRHDRTKNMAKYDPMGKRNCMDHTENIIGQLLRQVLKTKLVTICTSIQYTVYYRKEITTALYYKHGITTVAK